MSYIIYYSDPAKTSYPITVADNTIYNGVGTGGLTLVGRNYPGYGQSIAENLIHLLENSANSVPPVNPIEGQLWYDNASKKLKINNGAASNANWKPINGIYQQSSEPVDGVAGDIWVDTLRNQVFIHNGSGFNTLIGPEYSSTGIVSGPKVETITDSLGEDHQVIKFYLSDNEWVVISEDAFITADMNGFSSISPGINLRSDATLNGIADSANYLRQNNAKVSGNSFVRNDINQVINGQITITQDGNALKIGTDPTFIIERTSNGSNANFVNTYQSYGTFAFNIKDDNFANVRLMTIGGENRQVRIFSNTPAVNTGSGALVVAGGASIGQDLYVGGNLKFTSTDNTLTVAQLILTGTTESTGVGTGTLVISGGLGVAKNIQVGGDLYVKKKLFDQFGRAGTGFQVLVSSGGGVYWSAINTGGFTGGTIPGLVSISSSLSNALSVAGGAIIGGNLQIGGVSTFTGLISGSSATFALLSATAGLRATSTASSTSTNSGALVVTGGAGIGGDLYVGGGIFSSRLTIDETIINSTVVQTNDQFTITNTTNASSTVTGALRVSGGAGIGRNLYIGGIARVLDTTAATNSTTGALSVAGGASIQGSLYVGSANVYFGGAQAITTSSLGGVRIDQSTIISSSSGTISVNTSTPMFTATYATYVTTPATSFRLGGVFIGSNIDVNAQGFISLSPATDSKLGLVRVANNSDLISSGLKNNEGIITLDTATSTLLGGVRIGSNITISANGTISVADPYTLPIATPTVLGGVKIGNGITVSSSGTISVNTASFVYSLPPATTSNLGGVKLPVDQPTMYVDYPSGEFGLNYNFTSSSGVSVVEAWNSGSNIWDLTVGLNVASPTVLGGVKIGAGIGIAGDGTISVTTASFALQTATSVILGGVKIGSNVNISGDGTISVAAPYVLNTATAGTLGGVKIGSNVNISGDGTISVATGAGYVLNTATGAVLGGVKIGSNVNVSGDGTISVAAPYVLTSATGATLGGVKIGSSINISGDGTINLNTSTLVASAVTAGTATYATFVSSTATNLVLGGVKIGTGLTAAVDGTVSVNTSTLVKTSETATYATFVTTPATTTTLGGVKVGTNIVVDLDGTISVPAFPLTTATALLLGGVRIGNNINIDGSGIISVSTLNGRLTSTYNATSANGFGNLFLNGSTNNRIDFASVGLSAPNASSRSDGTKIVLRPGVDGSGVDVGFGVDTNTLWSSVYNSTHQYRWYAGTTPVMTLAGTGSLVVSGPIFSNGFAVSTQTYTLNAASTTTLGGVKIGANINVAGDGTISVTPSAYTLPAATTSTLGGVIVGSNLGVDISGVLSFNTNTLVTNAIFATQATRLQNARTINGVAFDGTANIVVSSTTTSALSFGNGLSGSSASFNGSTPVSLTLAAATTSTIGGITGVVNGNIALGLFSGLFSQGQGGVALGTQAGQSSQGTGAVAIGTDSGVTSQSAGAIAIGASAGNTSQGANAIAIGNLAGVSSQAANSIILNASGSQLNTSTTNSLLIKPIRTNGSTPHFLFYNPVTSEVTTASTLANIVKISDVTQATSTATGALQVSGGASVGGNMWIGGQPIMPNRIAMRVYGTASGDYEALTLTNAQFTVDYNTGGALNTSTGVFTAPTSGTYLTTLTARVPNVSSGTNQVAVLKNDSNSAGNSIAFWETNTNTGATHFSVSGQVYLNVNDTLRTKILLGKIQFDNNDNWTVTFLG